MTRMIPTPKSYRFDSEGFELAPATLFSVSTTPENATSAPFLIAALSRYLGSDVALDAHGEHVYPVSFTLDGSVTEVQDLTVDVEDPAAQRYSITLSETGIEVVAAQPIGWLYATAALRDLVDVDPAGSITVTTGEVEDEPRYGWRGFSMDIARNFYGLDQLTVLLDLLASYRLNVLHLHLTDDQGWRIQLDCHPELTEISGATSMDGGRSGFLTKDDYEELQIRAAARGIVVIPEIDVPGHVNAIQHALGGLTPDGEKLASYGGAEVGFSKLYPELPATYEFLTDVFTELSAMTHGPWIHIGGDEALESTPAEYLKIMQFAVDVVRQAGKRHVGWQELGKSTVSGKSVIQYWNMNENSDYLIDAAARGASFVISPANRIYFDMKNRESQGIGVDWAGHTPLSKSYEWDPATAKEGLPEGSVLGVEAALWTERVPQPEIASLLLLPRLLAAAEVAWSQQEDRDFASFCARLPAQRSWWATLGLAHDPSPEVAW